MTKNKTSILVSVITAFYNEERFLAETIESVIRQKFSHWELILVDDGSTDKSTNIAKQYAAKYSGKIIYIDHEGHANRGLSASRNHGISIARGYLLAFLDADDVWLPRKLKLQVAIMNKYPNVGMLCEASTSWYTWKNKNFTDVKIQIGCEQDKIFYPPELLENLYPLSSGYAPVPSAIMIRKEIAEKHGSFEAHFTGKYQLYEDQGFLHKIYLNEAVYISSACNNKYRQRTGSLVQAIRSDGSYDIVRKYFLDWLKKYMEENNFINERTAPLLRKAFRRYEERDNPCISVVTIYRNHQQYLAETIESMLSQSYSNWEYILINDGATDSSVAIAESYASRNKKISLYSHEGKSNKGVGVSRNLGIRYAGGKYIAFLDVGYIWLPRKLEEQVTLAKQYPNAAILFEKVSVASGSSKGNLESDVRVGLDIDKLFLAPDLLYKMEPYGRHIAPMIGSALMDTFLVQSVHCFDESFAGINSYYVDLSFLVKSYLNFPIYFSTVCNTLYRELPPECLYAESKKGDYQSGRSYFLKWTQKYLKGYRKDNPVASIIYKRAYLAHKFPWGFRIASEQYNKLKDLVKGKKSK